MSKLTTEQWSTLWTRETVTTLSSMFPDNYDLSVAEFWLQVLEGEHERVIDLACGNGALVWLANDALNRNSARTMISGVDVAAIDPFTTLKKDIKDYPMVEFIGGTPIEALPFDNNSVDVAISQYGLEYSDLQRSIPELGRVLKPTARMGFVLHNEQSTILKSSTRYLDQHKLILNDIRIHDLFLELDSLIGKSRDLKKISAKPKIKKTMVAINAASDRIKQIMRVVDPESEILRYCIPMFDAFSEDSVRKRVNRKKVIRQSISDLGDYIGRIEDLESAALSRDELASLVGLIEKEGFTVIENKPLEYKKSDNIGIALVADRTQGK
jgi:ubiquinone/menaquinone biosynthesis C-methylase UbiE